MPTPRKLQIAVEATPYYHCISRCVRRAFLCGVESHTGQSFEHRRDWVESRLLHLAQIFAIDVAAYAVMSNHMHIVLHIDLAAVQSWSHSEIVLRWHKLFSGDALSKRAVAGHLLNPKEQEIMAQRVAIWRERLVDISWFMRCLNEPIARQANLEDHAKDHFWEGRFKSQALCDEQALAACMVYVDLNPIRAKLALTPEESDFTSVQHRIVHLKNAISGNTLSQPADLMPFVGEVQHDLAEGLPNEWPNELPKERVPKGLPFHLQDYLELLEWTGRIVRTDKHGAIPKQLPPILTRLGIYPDNWLTLTQTFSPQLGYLAGLKRSVVRIKNIFKTKRSSARTCSLFGS